MYFDEILQKACVKAGPPDEEDIILLPAGLRATIDSFMVISKSDFEAVLMKHRANEPASEAVLSTIGTACRVGVPEATANPIWELLVNRASVLDRYTALCNEQVASKLDGMNSGGGEAPGPEEAPPDFSALDKYRSKTGADATAREYKEGDADVVVLRPEEEQEPPAPASNSGQGGGSDGTALPSGEGEPPLPGEGFGGFGEGSGEAPLPGEGFGEPPLPGEGFGGFGEPPLPGEGFDGFGEPPLPGEGFGGFGDTQLPGEGFDSDVPSMAGQESTTPKAPKKEHVLNLRYEIPGSDGMNLYQDTETAFKRYDADVPAEFEAPEPEPAETFGIMPQQTDNINPMLRGSMGEGAIPPEGASDLFSFNQGQFGAGSELGGFGQEGLVHEVQAGGLGQNGLPEGTGHEQDGLPDEGAIPEGFGFGQDGLPGDGVAPEGFGQDGVAPEGFGQDSVAPEGFGQEEPLPGAGYNPVTAAPEPQSIENHEGGAGFSEGLPEPGFNQEAGGFPVEKHAEQEEPKPMQAASGTIPNVEYREATVPAFEEEREEVNQIVSTFIAQAGRYTLLGVVKQKYGTIAGFIQGMAARLPVVAEQLNNLYDAHQHDEYAVGMAVVDLMRVEALHSLDANNPDRATEYLGPLVNILYE